MNNNSEIEKDFEKVFLEDENLLTRFGLLMRKLAFFESEVYLSWLPSLNESIHSPIVPGQGITFA